MADVVEEGATLLGTVLMGAFYGMGFIAGGVGLYVVTNNLVGALGNSVRARLG